MGMKEPLPSSIKSFQALVSARRYVYHILHVPCWQSVRKQGQLVSRNALGPIKDDYAMPELIVARSSMSVTDGIQVNDMVPFYLTPRQPMFCRLIREKVVEPMRLVAIGFDFERLFRHYPHWLFTSNPAYPGSRLLGNWEARHELAWDVLERWWWNCDDDPKEEKLRLSFLRQAELLVRGPVMLTDVGHVIVDSTTALESELGDWLDRVIEIPGVFEW